VLDGDARHREANGLLIIQEGESKCLEKMKWVPPHYIALLDIISRRKLVGLVILVIVMLVVLRRPEYEQQRLPGS
jgi:hypothetical protein